MIAHRPTSALGGAPSGKCGECGQHTWHPDHRKCIERRDKRIARRRQFWERRR